MDISLLQSLSNSYRPLTNQRRPISECNNFFQSMLTRQGFNPGVIAPAIKSGNSSNIINATVYMNCLVSMGSGSGQELHMNYDESSTDEEPVILAWGKDMTGQEFKQKIYVNDIDPEYATPAEMIALNAHLSKQGDKDVQNSGPGPLWISLNGYDVNTKLNFKQYLEEWIDMQNLGGGKQNAALYQLQLDRYLLFNDLNSEQ